MKKIVIEFTFKEEVDEYDEYYTYVEHVDTKIVETDLTDNQRQGVAESWAQSDRYWVDTCWDIINKIAGE